MEKTVGSRVVYDGRIIRVRVDEVELPGGKTATREVVEHGGAVAVVALTENGEVYFVRQFRKALEKELMEIPAGKLEAGEDPAVCAARELAEETGMAPGRLQLLASFYTSPGFASEKIYVYLATGLVPARAEAPEDEILQAYRLPLGEALALARAGKIEDAKTLVGLLLLPDTEFKSRNSE